MSNTCEVYRAEHKLCSPAWLEAIADPQTWVTHVTEHRLFKSLRRDADLPNEIVTVVPAAPPQRRRACAHPTLQIIEIPPGFAPTQHTLLHEVAHLCTPAGAYHDERFAASLVSLTRFWLGEVAARELLLALRSTKVPL